MIKKYIDSCDNKTRIDDEKRLNSVVMKVTKTSKFAFVYEILATARLFGGSPNASLL